MLKTEKSDSKMSSSAFWTHQIVIVLKEDGFSIPDCYEQEDLGLLKLFG